MVPPASESRPADSEPADAASPAVGPRRRAPGPPRVAIVGRPNVGKSTLFNVLVRSRVAIEDPTAGVTRDRVSFVLDTEAGSIEVVDTGGIGLVDEALLKAEIDEQIATALAVADLIVFVFDAKLGISPLDKQVARRVRRLGVPVIPVANKVEGVRDEANATEGAVFGMGDPWEVSAREAVGVADLRDEIVRRAVEIVGDDAQLPMMPSDIVRLAIIGRMNVGKSTLVNNLVGEDRVIVSDVPGTTRDAIDVPFSLNGRRFVAIDTAGIRKRSTVSDSVEFYSQARAERAIRRADVALLMLDATREVGRIDRQIAGLVTELSVPCIIVLTKWDLAKDGARTGDYEKYLDETLPFMGVAPRTFISGLDGTNVPETLALAAELHDQGGRRVGTGEVNRVVKRAYEKRRPRPQHGQIGKIKYSSQVGTYPPTILFFVNDPDLFDDSWKRFLMGELQEQLGFEEIPVKLVFQRRGDSKDGGR